MKSLFFVYGTLKKGYGNHPALKDSLFIGEATSVEKYKVFNCGFPMAFKDKEGLKVKGELYSVTQPEVVERLDQIEGNGHFYTRAIRKFRHIETGKLATAWIYEINDHYRLGTDYCKVNKQHNAYEWSR
jgi:gamma-glutamylaminecyclotransferase